MQDSRTNGNLGAAEVAAVREDQDGVAGLGFAGGERAASEGSDELRQ